MKIRKFAPFCSVGFFVLSLFYFSSCRYFSSQNETVSSSESNRKLTQLESTSETERLKSVHQALFETYFPMAEAEKSVELKRIALKRSDQMWELFSKNANLLRAYEALNTISPLAGGFDRVPLARREALLASLQRSPINAIRKAAYQVRLIYMNFIYSSELGLYLSGRPHPQQPIMTDLKKFREKNHVEFHHKLIYKSDAEELTHADGELDYIIVGSGPAGAVLAHELSGAGKRVVLVDQGSFPLPGAADTRKLLYFHESQGIRTSNDGGVIFRNGNALGGGATINIDLAFSPTLPIVQQRVEAWKKKGAWPTEGYDLPQMEKAYNWVKEKIGTRVVAVNEVNGNNEILWKGALAHGATPSLYDLNTYRPQRTDWSTDKKSPVETLILPAMQRKENPLSVIPDVKVQKVLFESAAKPTRATGVEIKVLEPWPSEVTIKDPHDLKLPPNRSLRIHARNVIISAGTLGSAVLLKKSGLKNPQIGKGFVGHVSIPLIGEFDRPVKAWEGTPATVHVDSYALKEDFILESMTADEGYVAMMLPGSPRFVFDTVKQYQHLGGFGVLLIDTPSEFNKISLGSDGEVEISYALSTADRNKFRHGVAEAVRILFKAGAKKVILPTNENLSVPMPLTEISQADLIEKELNFVPNRTTITSAHMQASNKMGRDPANSVVSHDFKVWGTENLYVIDSSVFPSSVGANPMQSIYTFAKIAADRLTGR